MERGEAVDEYALRELLRLLLPELGRGPDLAPPTAEGADPVDRFIAAAQAADVAFVRREATPLELDRLLDADALPLVLWGAERAAVLRGGAEGASICVPGRPERALPEQGGAAEALAVVGSPALLLVPVGVDPSFSAPEADAHPTPTGRLIQLLHRERREIELVFIYAVLAGALSLTLPLGVQAITGLVSGGLILQPVIVLIAFVVIGALLGGVLQIFQLGVVELLQQRIFARLAFEFAFRLPRIKVEALGGEQLPETVNRFFETVTIQKSLAKLLTESSTAFLQVVFGLLLLTFYHPWFAAFAALLLAVVLVVFRITGPRGIATALAESAEKYHTVRWLQEVGRAVTAFKFGGRAAFAVERMDRYVTAYLHHRKAHFRVLVQQAMIVVAFKTITIGGVLILGSVLVIERQITLGQFVASEIVIVTVLAALEKLILSISTVYDVLAAVEKAGHVTDLELERAGGRVLPGAGGGTALAVRVDGLSYTYPGAEQPALADVTLDIAPGQRVVLTGSDGSGQSTLLRVLAALYTEQVGGLRYDGVPLGDLDLAALRADIGQFLSPTDLFDGPIEDNVRLGRLLSASEVAAALELAGAMDWVATLPEGMRTGLEGGGAGLPTHLAQRLLFAQAIAGQPRMVVLDDFFQHLESETREEFLAVLMDRARPWTVIAVAHDPAFFAAADRVLVLREGRVTADGPLDAVADDPLVRAICAPVVGGGTR